MPLGYIDYGIFQGWDISVNACYPTPPPVVAGAPNNNLPGQSATASGSLALLGTKGTVIGGTLNLSQKIHITDMVDGTTNTILVGESAGKQQVYQLGTAVMPNTPGAPGWTLNAAWADYNTKIYVYGFTANGVTTGGCSIMNVTNADGGGTAQSNLFVPHRRREFPPGRRVGDIHHQLAAARRAHGSDDCQWR